MVIESYSNNLEKKTTLTKKRIAFVLAAFPSIQLPNGLLKLSLYLAIFSTGSPTMNQGQCMNDMNALPVAQNEALQHEK